MKELSEKLKEFCEKAELMRLSYVDKNGGPHAVPIWFTALEGCYYFGTYSTALKTKALKSNPKAGWVIDDGERPRYWGASFSGHVEEVNDATLRELIYKRLGEKYYGNTEDEEFIKVYGLADDANTTYFKLVPEIQTSWEY
ncbi:MAG TPA: pyridoxamine 5'-phosphate oxidase family protein [Blastocatellia bacterium]|nr:pyridoxamine 5'-phosphate oxidase family protein [Blastocatellia bacterium]